MILDAHTPRILSAAAVRETAVDAGTPSTNGMGWWSNSEVESTCLPASGRSRK
jgi:hypothetical protein